VIYVLNCLFPQSLPSDVPEFPKLFLLILYWSCSFFAKILYCWG
jgi:hypothetical protein